MRLARSRAGLVAAAALLLTAALGAMLVVTRLGPQEPRCSAPADHPEWSVARRWDEALLDAIRRALPNPPVHARNLFHVSVAMWDAWAAYDPAASGYLFHEKFAAGSDAARNEAISYAAYRVLSARYIKAVGGAESLSEFDDVMDSLCYPLTATTTAGDSPAAIGNRIAATVLAYGATDGSNEANGYAAAAYEPVNAPLVVAQPGLPALRDPNRWQPLQLEHMISQNGIPVTNGVQQAIAPHWGHVKGFAVADGGPNGTPIDPGPPPRLGDPATDAAYKQQAIDVIRDSSLLDDGSDATIDVSPATRGGNTLGANDGHGHAVNPATGKAYEPQLARSGDFYRVVAEFWADGPKSETPPGHWNTIANLVSDELASNLRIGGAGEHVGRLEWDVKLYLALNGAVHDAAIAAWGLKGHYDSVRPISMIRYLAGRGQSTDPKLPSYDPHGLPLVADLVELITPRTTAPGQRHAALEGHEGEVAVRAWRGNPADPKTQSSGVHWIRGVEWVPYQLPTFVTPSFPGYVSGHSTFSRAAAEVLAAFTGSEYFPGGVSGYTIEPGSLKTEAGPSTAVRLEWATYFDAADQAGQSRLLGGIHIEADDLTGRRIGAQCGRDAWARAQLYYTGRAG